ncbi:glycosyltransferase [bacterium]|nr:glycosyltransferase [bacterium]
MTKKKILVWETLGTVSGGQKMTLTILDMLSDQYEFCCLIPKEGMLSEELKKRNISYVLMGDQTLPTGVKGKQVIFRYGWMSLKNIWKSWGIIRKYKPDMLYCPGPAALPWSAICGILTEKPVIWHLHHIFLDGATKKLLNICGKFNSVRKIIAVSNCVGNQIVADAAHKKVEVLYNPVDVQKYANGDSTSIKAEIEKIFGYKLDDTRNVIGHVALVQRSKRQDFVLNVIAELKKRGINSVGIFAGEAREPDFLEELKQHAKDLNISDDVTFLGRRSDIPDLLKMTDVLMIPSSFEGFPLAGLEAAAAGVPVAACNVAGAEEFIRVSGDGACFTENNVEEAVKAIETIMVRKAEMAENGRTFAAKMSNAEYASRIGKEFGKIV